MSDDKVVELHAYICDECHKPAELLAIIEGKELCENCSPEEYWTEEAIYEWHADRKLPEGPKAPGRELSDEELDEQLEEMCGWKAGEGIVRNLAGVAMKVLWAPYQEAQRLGTIRGLEFRIAELERDKNTAIDALQWLEELVPERGGALKAVQDALEALGVSVERED